MANKTTEQLTTDIAKLQKQMAELKKQKRLQERKEQTKREQLERQRQIEIDKKLLEIAKQKTLNSNGKPVTFYDCLMQFYNEQQRQ